MNEYDTQNSLFGMHSKEYKTLIQEFKMYQCLKAKLEMVKLCTLAPYTKTVDLCIFW